MSRATILVASIVGATAQTPALGSSLVLLPCSGGFTQSYDLPNSTFPFLEEKIVVRGWEVPPQGDEILLWCIANTPQLGATMHLWGNSSTDFTPQLWSWNSTSQLVRSTAPGQTDWCVGAPPVPGIPLTVVVCNAADPSQLFHYNATSGAFSLVSSPSFCVDAGSAPPNCSTAPFSSFTYCNASAAPTDRAADLVSRLTVVDMAYVLEQTNPGIPRLGIPSLHYNEALHGVVYGCGPSFYNESTGFNSTGCPTSFPHGTLLGSAFNRSLWLSIGQTISDEGRALHNTIGYGIQTWAPDINPARDPRWGRGQEVAGEDAWLLGQYVWQFARGFQEGEDQRFTKILSTAKHWAAYDLENWGDVSRQNFTAVLTPQMTTQYYFVPFQQAAKVVKSFMCSYNAVTVTGTSIVGIPACANGAFINDVLRGQWGWEGYVVSDCSAIANVLATHHYVETPEAAAEVCMAAGTDVECEFNDGAEIYESSRFRLSITFRHPAPPKPV